MSFDPQRHVLALDFDGVIGNSVNECLIVAYNAFYGLKDADRVKTVDALNPVLVQNFRRMRNLIRGGADFLFILLALEKELDIRNQKAFDAFTETNHQREHEFFEAFYQEREYLSSRHPDVWVQLNPLYEGMEAFLKQYPQKQALYIITTKKIFFVKKILAFYSIPLVPGNLFTSDKTKSKREILLEIKAKHKINPEQLWYIDDQVDTLIKIQNTGIQCLLAEWGYNDEAQHKIGGENGILPIKLEEFRNNFGSLFLNS